MKMVSVIEESDVPEIRAQIEFAHALEVARSEADDRLRSMLLTVPAGEERAARYREEVEWALRGFRAVAIQRDALGLPILQGEKR